ncbi:MAG: glycoside hydrolase family 18, partial [Selenomonadales bacterium]|nr:glycoside hydrolase family 18 [Selenomonadales bacterium]
MKLGKRIRGAVIMLLVLLFALGAGGCDTMNITAELPPEILNKMPVEMQRDPIGYIKGLLPKKEEQRMILGYYENPWPNTPDEVGSLPSMRANADAMTGVAPYWFRATADGTLESKQSQLAYDEARAAGLSVYPLVTNKREATETILGSEPMRNKTIDSIMKVIDEQGFDGINLDFELVPAYHKDNLTAFVTALYKRMKDKKKTLIVSVFPKIDVDESVHGAYDYEALSKQSDYLQIMAYDRHWATSEAGAIAPIGWFEDNLKYAIEHGGGAGKIIIGLSLYGYDWGGGEEAETVTYVDATVRAQQHGAEIFFDQTDRAPYFVYDGHEVWFEDQRSIDAKMDVI